MTTIVVHGTMTVRAAKHARWWWDSWSDGGFLDAVARSMTHRAGSHDVWRVAGAPVSEVSELQTHWKLLSGTAGQVSAVDGHFTWSGANAGFARDAGAAQLARYLNQVAALTSEPIRVIAHSHGCNVVKAASCHRTLSQQVHIDRAVFLACPHFVAQGHDGAVFTYRLDPRRFSRILNLFSDDDSVQVGLADKLFGPPGARIADFLGQAAQRMDADAQASHLYENGRVHTEARGLDAHTVLHGSVVGGLVGLWLGGDASFAQLLEQVGGHMPAIPADDVGES